jgi:hypothetical protein
MCLTAEQHSQIATYEKAAADEALPSQLRTAFVNKANGFGCFAKLKWRSSQ